MSKSYFKHGSQSHHEVRITLIEESPGHPALVVETNTTEGLILERPPEERTYRLPFGRSVTIVIED